MHQTTTVACQLWSLSPSVTHSVTSILPASPSQIKVLLHFTAAIDLHTLKQQATGAREAAACAVTKVVISSPPSEYDDLTPG